MEYTRAEKDTLEMMQKTDFKNISKNDVLSITSKLEELRPDVAKEIIAQFPEMGKLVQSLMGDYQNILDKTISSDDESIKQVYAVSDREMTNLANSREQFYAVVNNIQYDLSNCLSNPDITAEERNDIICHEIEVLKIVSEKDTETSDKEIKIIEIVDNKDSQKRQFNWGIILQSGGIAIAFLGIAIGALGGHFNFRLPKDK